MPLTRDDQLRELLTRARRIAVVGASNRPERASYGVIAALLAHGYRVAPVNPQLTGATIHGQPVMASLADVAGPIDIVDVFRKAADLPPVVAAAIAARAGALWLQLGIADDAAAATAEAAGLAVVMDRCIKVELARLGVPPVAG